MSLWNCSEGLEVSFYAELARGLGTLTIKVGKPIVACAKMKGLNVRVVEI